MGLTFVNMKCGFRHVLLLLFLLLFTTTLTAQGRQELQSLYAEGNIEELGGLLQSGGISYPDWQLYIEALFETDGEAAIRKMMAAYLQAEQGQLKVWVRERVAAYYAAGGSYGASSRILRDEAYFQTLLDEWVRDTGPRYGIQVGAYTAYENAQARKSALRNSASDIIILEKSRRGSVLYTVVIGGYASRADAERAAETLRASSTISEYMITQY